MKTLLKITTLLILTVTLFSCDKEDEIRKGCTDPAALNYFNLAVEDDGSCEYSDLEFTVWNKGAFGFWDNEITGAFGATSCVTDTAILSLSSDTTIVPADTLIVAEDLTATPPIVADTTITPADTTIAQGDTYLVVNSDANGRYELVVQLLNKKNALEFASGSLVFKAKLLPGATMGNFDVAIHGNHYNIGKNGCSDYHSSNPFAVSTASLDTASFKEISIPLLSFTKRHLNSMDVVFSIKGDDALPNTNLMLIDQIKWVARVK